MMSKIYNNYSYYILFQIIQLLFKTFQIKEFLKRLILMEHPIVIINI